jgi:hypothetical protein
VLNDTTTIKGRPSLILAKTAPTFLTTSARNDASPHVTPRLRDREPLLDRRFRPRMRFAR